MSDPENNQPPAGGVQASAGGGAATARRSRRHPLQPRVRPTALPAPLAALAGGKARAQRTSITSANKTSVFNSGSFLHSFSSYARCGGGAQPSAQRRSRKLATEHTEASAAQRRAGTRLEENTPQRRLRQRVQLKWGRSAHLLDPVDVRHCGCDGALAGGGGGF